MSPCRQQSVALKGFFGGVGERGAGTPKQWPRGLGVPTVIPGHNSKPFEFDSPAIWVILMSRTVPHDAQGQRRAKDRTHAGHMLDMYSGPLYYLPAPRDIS